MGRESVRPPDISTARDPDLRASMQALRRAAELARKTAIQTGTHLVIVENGELRRISAQELIEQEASEAAAKP